MIQKIIDGICTKLHDTFGYEIYTEDVEQGLNEPCFSISCINPTNTQFLGQRYFRSHQFCIYYFPSSAEPNAECLGVLGRLYDALEYIEVEGDLVRGTNMRGEMPDDVLCFFVNYDMFVVKQVEKVAMEHLNHDGTAKE